MARQDAFSLFDTAIGVCAIAWTDRGVSAVQLPEGDAQATRSRLVARRPGAVEAAPPPPVAQAIAQIQDLMAGRRVDLGGIALDMAGVPDFHKAVYAVALSIPPGRTLTYGDIARRLGDPEAARAVGQALGRNPFPIIVPCHRVLAANGRPGGFSAHGGRSTKLRMLAIEGFMGNEPTLFDPR
ncbi:methylated-DNA--[protein]-cysteine S-methyltransferase [Alsobacter sp. KACC 23698]|uniref:methylated-DNA--[protein]-cysteine S-methyltransferase n=1 Tax=Alsobacter sp. KACC 23698 TaxID=3149229 RepID=A0AAU7JIS3_9HYPH